MVPWKHHDPARNAHGGSEHGSSLTQLPHLVSNMLNRLGGQPESYDKK